MSPTIGIIIALVYLAIHVASFLAKEASKRKERERRMQEAERQRITHARMEAPSGESHGVVLISDPFPARTTAPSKPQPTSVRAGRSLDDLAAKRKQQLEQLRARASGQSPTAGRSTTGVPGRSQATFGRSGEAAATLARERERERERQRQMSRARTEREAVTAKQREMLAKAREAKLTGNAERAPDKRAGAVVLPETDEPIERHRPDSVHKHQPPVRVLERLKNRADLRDLIVFKEILDPPVALRNGQ